MIPEPVVAVDGVDITCDVALGVTIRHGGDGLTQPEPATATLTLIATDDTLLAKIPLNGSITIDARMPDTTLIRRFTGTITDVDMTWDSLALATVRVIAASPAAMLGRVFVGDEPWPLEDDGARATRILSLTAATVGVVDPGTLDVLARDIDRQPALGLLQELAVDAGGYAWHDRAGQICYADADHRRKIQPSLALSCEHILMSPQWQQNTGSLVNDTTVTYGTATGGGDQPFQRAIDQPSIDTYGRVALHQSTQLAAAADAASRAELTITRGAYPSWDLPHIPIDLAVPAIGETLTRALLDLEIHDLFGVIGLPEQGPATQVSLWVEGWDERIDAIPGAGSWQIDFRVSDYCRGSPEPTWDGTSAAYTWDTIPDVTWRQVTCLPPSPTLGSWDDTAANVTWDSLNDQLDWDEWEN